MLLQSLFAFFVQSAVLISNLFLQFEINSGAEDGEATRSHFGDIDARSSNLQRHSRNRGRPFDIGRRPYHGGFKYIGSLSGRGSGSRFPIGINNFDENSYYLSLSPTEWSTSKTVCKSQFGQNASLVSIESQIEKDGLDQLLDSHEIIQPGKLNTYWTSGMFDAVSKVWRWEQDNKILPSWAPWDNGYPTNPASPAHRVLIAHTTRVPSKWRTITSTQNHNFICEISSGPPPNPDPVPCTKPNDLVIVLDSSHTLGTQNYAETKSFVEKLSAAFTEYATSRLGFVIYSSSVRSIFNLTDILTRETKRKLILSAPYLAEAVGTSGGIIAAGHQFATSPRDVPKNLLVMTAGTSNNQEATAAAAEWANSDGISTFVVGITSGVNNQELLAIAGGNQKNVFTADNFNKLKELLKPISLALCPN